MTYEVTAVRYGALSARKSALYHRFETYGEPDAEVEMAYFFWLLRGDQKTALVDTGFAPAVAARRGRTSLVEPLAALQRLGVSPEQVSTVVVTHFHYDHIGNLAAFPRAEIVVPRAELEFWTGPWAGRTQFAAHVEQAEVERVLAAAREGRVRLIEGDEEILPGVRAFVVGGHSPGQQVTLVQTGDRPVALASDAVHFYDELEQDRPFGVIHDLEAMYRAYELLRELAAREGAAVVPGHDPLVAERFAPATEDGGVAVRLDLPVEAMHG
jgi:glyoxylase-like metal-dependent hydrolase (beta-lactamase superfamily II)